MAPASSRRMAWLLAAALQCTAFTQALPARAASALAAWAFTEEGVLKLRTSRNARLEAFFQAASDGRGTRRAARSICSSAALKLSSGS